MKCMYKFIGKPSAVLKKFNNLCTKLISRENKVQRKVGVFTKKKVIQKQLNLKNNYFIDINCLNN